MRKTQLTLNRMRKYQLLVNNKQYQQEEGQTLHYELEGKVDRKDLQDTEVKLDELRTKLNKYISEMEKLG
eukprot:9098806-Heterocapsa_arctica.AAC.1